MTIQMEVEHVAGLTPEQRAEYDEHVPARVVRFKELRPEWSAYGETLLPGHERALYGYVGGAAAENPTFAPVVAGENFTFALVYAEPGKGAPLHAHVTEEV